MKRTPSLLLVDDDDAFRLVMSGELARMGFEVRSAASGGEAVEAMELAHPDLALLDLQLPDMSGLDVLKRAKAMSPETEIIMLTGHGSIDTAIEAIQAGAFDYIAKPCPLDELEVRLQRALDRRSVNRKANLLERGLTPRDPTDWCSGKSPEFLELLGLAEKVAASDSTILITGETGSGKEMVAKLLHSRSQRKERPFIVVECAALQEELLQSELFGHERGSFTGADRAKAGLFEVADGGTIFLDEIGEVSPATQVKLLRVLDSSTFRHVGGTKEIQVNVRILAATNRDLSDLVAKGRFREDLYYRLSTIILRVPPLRRRGGDVELLARHFVGILSDRFGLEKRIGPQAMDLLQRHDWPGNVRELMHALERAMVVCEGEEILPEHLPAVLRMEKGPAGHQAQSGPLPSLADMERDHIERVLEAVKGHRGSAAEILGISERNLYRKLNSYRLS